MTVNVTNKKYAILQKPTINNQDITVNVNGNYYPSDEYTGFGLVRVRIPDPILESVTVNPKITTQEINPPTGVDAFSKVIVNPVTSAIDSNIKPQNIVKGIKILGVTGTVEYITDDLSISPTTSKQTFTPPHDGFGTVTVAPVTFSIDSNIVAENIRKGVTILGVKGDVVELNNTTRDITANGFYTAPAPYTGFSEVNVDVKVQQDALTINPTTSKQTFTAIDEYHGYSPVTVNAVTSAIDSNIKAGNIKKGVTILGVTGTSVELNTTTLNITANGTYTPTTPYNGFSTVTVDVDTVNNTNIKITKNGIYNAPNPYTGFGTVTVDINTVNNTDITISANGTYTPKPPYTGFGTVVVDFSSKMQEKTITPTATTTVVTPDSGKYGLSKVTIDLSWIDNALKRLNAGDTATSVKLQNKTITSAGTYKCDNGYDGLGTVTVNLDWVDQAIEEASQQAADGNLDMLLNDNAISISTDADRIRPYAFYKAEHLQKVILNNATSIGEYAFANSGVTKLFINTPTMCALTNTNAFTKIPTIYVPSNLLNKYKTNSVWSKYASSITSE